METNVCRGHLLRNISQYYYSSLLICVNGKDVESTTVRTSRYTDCFQQATMKIVILSVFGDNIVVSRI